MKPIEALLIGLVVALGAAAIILYGAGSQPQVGGSAQAIAPTHEVTMQPERRAAPPAAEKEPTHVVGSTPAAAKAAVDKAVAALAQRLGVGAEQIEVLSVQRLYKPGGVSDAPGVPIGWSVRLAVGSSVYAYSVDASGTVRAR